MGTEYMKKGKMYSYMNKRKYYLALLGCLLVIAVSLTVILTNDKKPEGLADLNEEVINELKSSQEEGQASNSFLDDSPVILGSNQQTIGIDVEAEAVSPPETVETYMPMETAESFQTDSAETLGVPSLDEIILDETALAMGGQENPDELAAGTKDEDILAEVNMDTEEVIPVISVQQPNINFSADQGILRPAQGDIILDFSSQVPVYYKTLEQYQVNEGVLIGCEIGSEVKAAADGIVEKIEKDMKRGVLITIYHGSGYTSCYGQLSDDINVKEGEIIDKGRIIGYVAEPTDYFLLEGTHLYFAMLQEGEAVNPNTLFR